MFILPKIQIIFLDNQITLAITGYLKISKICQKKNHQFASPNEIIDSVKDCQCMQKLLYSHSSLRISIILGVFKILIFRLQLRLIELESLGMGLNPRRRWLRCETKFENHCFREKVDGELKNRKTRLPPLELAIWF